jgi:hypothetical protein
LARGGKPYENRECCGASKKIGDLLQRLDGFVALDMASRSTQGKLMRFLWADRWADGWADSWAGRLVVSPRFSPCSCAFFVAGPIRGPMAFFVLFASDVVLRAWAD